jgi:hypothetical protein
MSELADKYLEMAIREEIAEACPGYSESVTSRVVAASLKSRGEGVSKNVYYRAIEIAAKRAEKARAERDALKALIGQVEWVFGSDEGEYCAWCWGEKPGDKPMREWCGDDEEYEQALEAWQRRGHKSDCPRQAALREGEGVKGRLDENEMD